MAMQTANTAVCKCAFGTAPGTLTATGSGKVMACTLPAATIQDMVITPMGNCLNPANPAAAAAMSAGATTPCTPAFPAPWAPGCATVTIGGVPALNSTSTLTCAFPGGVVTIAVSMATTVQVP